MELFDHAWQVEEPDHLNHAQSKISTSQSEQVVYFLSCHRQLVGRSLTAGDKDLSWSGGPLRLAINERRTNDPFDLAHPLRYGRLSNLEFFGGPSKAFVSRDSSEDFNGSKIQTGHR